MTYRFTKIQSNIAIWQYNACNTLKHNTQYGIYPHCFTPKLTMFTKMYTDIHVHTHVDVYVHKQTHAHQTLQAKQFQQTWFTEL